MEEIEEGLVEVYDPVHDEDIVTMGLIDEIEVDEEDEVAEVALKLGAPYAPHETEIAQNVRDVVRDAGYEPSLRAIPQPDEMVPNIKNVILVSSGKGGVGKTTVACNLAAGLAELGASTGILDADIQGPNVPSTMGVGGDKLGEDVTLSPGERIIPAESEGVKVMSMDYLLPDDEAAIFRGPMVNKYIRSFLDDVHWGSLDYLVVDMPPGTGDVPLGMMRAIDVDGAVIVTTPQGVATDDTGRNIRMFRENDAPVLGVVENMSGFHCSSCGSEHELFGRGGGGRLAAKYEVPLLGEIPMQDDVGVEGEVPVTHDGRNVVARKFRDTAAVVANRVGEFNRHDVMEEERFSLPMV